MEIRQKGETEMLGKFANGALAVLYAADTVVYGKSLAKTWKTDSFGKKVGKLLIICVSAAVACLYAKNLRGSSNSDPNSI